MKYDLEDLKKISDELLPEAGPYMQRKIIDACLKQKKRTGFSRGTLFAAAGCTLCALAVFCVALSGFDVFGFGLNKPNDEVMTANAGEAGGTHTAVSPMTTAVSEDMTFVSASGDRNGNDMLSMESAGQVWFLKQNDKGLYGITDAYDKWVIEPEFENGYVVDDTIYLKNEGETKLFSVQGFEINE